MRILFILLFFSVFTYGQDLVWQTDSAYNFSIDHQEDSTALKELNSYIGDLYSSSPDTAIFYSRQQVALARKIKNKKLESQAYNSWGICLEYKGQADSAIVVYKLALKAAQETNDEKLLARIYNNLGIIYSIKGLYELSLEYTLKALEIHETRQDTNGMAVLYNNIGLRYSELNNQKKSIEYYRLAIKLNDYLVDKWRFGTNHSNLGRSYFLSEKYDSAKVHYEIAVNIAKETSNKLNKEISYSGLAFVYLKTDALEQAQLYADSTIKVALEIEDEVGIRNQDLLNGYLLNKRGQHEEALKYLLAFQDWNEKANLSGRSFEMYHEIAQTYRDLNRYPLALDYMEKFAFIKDTVYNSQKDLAIEQISIYQLSKEEKEKELLNQEIAFQKSLSNTLVIIGILIIIIALGIANRFLTERKTKRALAGKNITIKAERDRSEALLLNILPEEIAQELKEKGKADARDFDVVSILFSDFKGFTQASAKLSAQDLVTELNICFEAFDSIIEKNGIEKIKTIGDSFMAAGGVPVPKEDSIKNTVIAALEMQNFISKRIIEMTALDKPAFEMRVGIHTGPVVAGIVGVKKFQYDIWGDTVNTASRMESSGEVAKVNISQATYELLKADPDFSFESRGKIEAKGKGEIEMYFVSRTLETNSLEGNEC